MATKTIGQLTQATTINNADEFAIEQSGVTKRVAASVVRGDIVNANISASAAIAGSKLADGGVGTTQLANASVTPAKLSQPYTLATAQASTSGTSIDFTGIPSWARRITVMFNGVSTNGSSVVIIQLGTSSGFVTSGYVGSACFINNANSTGTNTVTAGLAPSLHSQSTDIRHGAASILNIASNAWTMSGTVCLSSAASSGVGCGSITLSGTLDRVRITTVNGTDTFDAGSINIAYEG